jgi:ABC-2 type transport system permease protein
MSLLRAARLLAAKDLRLYRRDRAAVVLGFLLPIGLITVFGFMMKFAFGGSGAAPKAELWVVDEDRTAVSAELIEALRGADTVRLRPREGDEPIDREEGRRRLEEGAAHHLLIVEPGYAEAVASGRTPKLVMLRDPGREMEDQLISLGLMQAVMSTTGGGMFPTLFGDKLLEVGLPEETVAEVTSLSDRMTELIGAGIAGMEGEDEAADEEGGTPADGTPADEVAGTGDLDFQSIFANLVPVEKVDVEPPERPKNLSYTLAQSVSGITVMMLMFGLVTCAGTLIEERDEGTLGRLMTSAIPRDSILFGKLFFTAVTGLVQLAVLFAWGELLFRVGMFRKPVTLLVLAVTLTAAVTAFGLLIAAWADTRKQADGVATLLILVMSALGGAWFPVHLFDLPVYAEVITRSTLTWWAMQGFNQMLWHQASWYQPPVLQALGVQWLFATVAAVLAWRLYRRRYVGG